MAGTGKPYILHITAGTPISGQWCDTCLLPSRITVPLYVMGEDGPSQIATVNRCDCDPSEDQ